MKTGRTVLTPGGVSTAQARTALARPRLLFLDAPAENTNKDDFRKPQVLAAPALARHTVHHASGMFWQGVSTIPQKLLTGFCEG